MTRYPPRFLKTKPTQPKSPCIPRSAFLIHAPLRAQKRCDRCFESFLLWPRLWLRTSRPPSRRANAPAKSPAVSPDTLEKLGPILIESGKGDVVLAHYRVKKAGDLTEAQAVEALERLSKGAK